MKPSDIAHSLSRSRERERLRFPGDKSVTQAPHESLPASGERGPQLLPRKLLD